MPAGGDAGPVAEDATRLREACATLDALLADDDAAAVDVFAQHAALLRSAFPGHHASIGSAIRTFDFEAARVLLTRAVAAST